MTRLLVNVSIFALFAGCGAEDVDKPNGTPGDDDDTGSAAAVGALVVAPDALVFAPGTEQLPLTLSNTGPDVVVVEDLAISDDAFQVSGPALPWEIPAGGEQSVDVLFVPSVPEHDGNLVFLTSEGTVVVPVRGEAEPPGLTTTPSTFEVELAAGCSDTFDVVLGNEGWTSLEVSAFLSSANLSVVEAPELPFVVEPGEAVPVSFAFTADGQAGAQSGTVEIVSSGPSAVVSWTADVDELDTFTEVYEVGKPNVDVMLMIDQSCSMPQDNTTDIEVAFPAFADALELTSDWRLSLFNDTSGCAVDGGGWDSTTPDLQGLLVDNAFPGPPSFNDPYYEWTESLLELSMRGIVQAGAGGCNEGMLREGAHLHVIVISDEMERSGVDASVWVAELESHVSAPGELVVSGVVDVNTSCGDGSGATGYSDAIAATGGLAMNICNQNWGGQFVNAAGLFPSTANIHLPNEGVDGIVGVSVGGVATTAFTYDDASQTVSVQEPVVLGDEVEVTYEALSTCL